MPVRIVVWPEALCGRPSMPSRGSVGTTIPSRKFSAGSFWKTASGAAFGRLSRGLCGPRVPMPSPSMKNSRTEASLVVMQQATLAIEIQLVVQRLQADAQQFRSARLVVLCLLQRAHDHLAFDFLERRADRQRQRVFVAQTLALFDRIRREVMTFDLFAGTDDHRALDDVA